MQLCGVRLRMSSPRHPQSDGASEVMNRMMENYIRCFCSYEQNDWDILLPCAEFAYNSAVSEDLGMSPFEVDLVWKPKAPLDVISGTSSTVETTEQFRKRLHAVFEDARYAHQLAKAKQAAESSSRCRDPQYKVGDKVWVSQKLFRDNCSRSQDSRKLSARWFGPFVVMDLVGKNAVRLEFPSHIKTHPVIHVSHTKKNIDQDTHCRQPKRATAVPVAHDEEGALFDVDRILNHRRRGRGYQWLTLLKGSPTHDAEWQPTRDFIDKDGTITKAFYEYIVEHGLLRHLH